MSVTYSQKNESTQKTSENAAASVLDYSTQSEGLQRKADLANAAAQRAEAPRPNNTGMPDNLKSGIESLSGFSMDDVRVHYNSSKPAIVQALAYTQGTDIHVAPGQEKHLPHEAWHVAQQMAGRVSPTTNINGVPVNDNAGLEHEADVMGEKAVQRMETNRPHLLTCKSISSETYQCSMDHLHQLPEQHTEAAYGKAAEGKKNSQQTSYKEFLPYIAFETMAGGNRIGELENVYKNVMKNYTGAASIYMGVNACTQYFYKEGNSVWVLKEGTNKTVNSSLAVTPLKYHSLTIIPFTWDLVGLGDKKAVLHTNEAGVTSLKSGQKPQQMEAKSDEKLKHEVSFYQNAADYVFPFFEARSLLMNAAHNSEADLFRWIDSDVSSDSSINEINQQGFKVFEKDWENVINENWRENFKRHLKDKQISINSRDDYETHKELFIQSKLGERLRNKNKLYSGFYKWTKTPIENLKLPSPIKPDIKGSKISEVDLKENYSHLVELVNQAEIDFRKDYFDKKNINDDTIYGPERKLDFYLPESTLYMNKNAHGIAKDLDSHVHGNDSQSREAEQVANLIGENRNSHIEVNKTFVVEKPLKKEFTTDFSRYSKPLEIIVGLIGGIVYNPIDSIDSFRKCIDKLRQCAFVTWTINESEKASAISSLWDKWILIKKNNYKDSAKHSYNKEIDDALRS